MGIKLLLSQGLPHGTLFHATFVTLQILTVSKRSWKRISSHLSNFSCFVSLVVVILSFLCCAAIMFLELVLYKFWLLCYVMLTNYSKTKPKQKHLIFTSHFFTPPFKHLIKTLSFTIIYLTSLNWSTNVNQIPERCWIHFPTTVNFNTKCVENVIGEKKNPSLSTCLTHS